ncbi:MAG TPA: hypothetical protein V6C52_11805 [Coleofasciculaceae cyanobacterium]|jgi:hypothetical protein
MPPKLPKNLPPSNDPFMYASILGGLFQDRNPIQTIVGDMGRMIHVLTHLNQNRQLAQMRIDQLQEQVQRVENAMTSATQKPAGSRFDRTR